MDAVQVQKKLELSPDEDSILTAWQYQMLQRDIAASKGKYLPSKRELRNSFRDNAVAAIVAREQSAEVTNRIEKMRRNTKWSARRAHSKRLTPWVGRSSAS
ncbi:hypothetical protein [Nocardia sp. XZ_19_231]|uniref:hypothetical protein n=1 Tax=Nocardia sp. XZ_19_231 TaxID=2769252 RepID=UPI00188E2518|nr:hypothetical protein [Nocardia sp. XZ_19_231]